MSRAGRLGAVFLLAACAAGCSAGRLKLGAGKDGEVVEAEGWSPSDPKDALGTKQRALVEAQKKAVEKVVGVFISAKTRVDQAVAVDQKILAKTAGYIKKYEVVREFEEGGFHKTRIRAFVLYAKVGEDLKEAGLFRPPPPPGNPKVVVMLRAAGGSKDADAASAALRRGLLERGFSVTDREDIPESAGNKPAGTAEAERAAALASNRLARTAEAERAAARAVGKKLEADLVVTGAAEVHPLIDERLGGFKSFRARVSVQVVKPSGGEVVAQKSQDASAIDPAEEVARSKALENAGLLAGEALAAELSASLKSRIGVTLLISGLPSLDQVQRLCEDLRGQPDVAAVTLSAYHGGAAELQVATDDLAGDALAAVMLRMKKYRFTALAVTPYEVELESQPE